MVAAGRCGHIQGKNIFLNVNKLVVNHKFEKSEKMGYTTGPNVWQCILITKGRIIALLLITADSTEQQLLSPLTVLLNVD